MHSEARKYIEDLNARVGSIANAAHDILVGLGCESYVKTIYIGYDIGGEMVAALYGHPNFVEIALALPEEAEGTLLTDAGHLTWRSLPVAAVLRAPADVERFRDLAATACDRVREQIHDVHRDNDYFIRSGRDRRPRG